MRTDKPLVLMGFMGSGKSTLGRRLAEILDIEFTDLDKAIEINAGMSIPEIFQKSGEPEFRKLESEALSKVLDKSRQVIAIGGGAPCNKKNIKLIKEKSISLYLKISIDELLRRLTLSDTPRPLLAGRNQEGIRIFISELLESREKYYLQADLVVESDSITAEYLAGRLTIDD